jgi:hypothetical protein
VKYAFYPTHLHLSQLYPGAGFFYHRVSIAQIGIYLYKTRDVMSQPGAPARYSGVGKRPAVNR